MSIPFKLMEHDLISGYTLVEASAGTGKTYSITWLVVRLLLEQELRAEDLLVVTFTIAATEELDSRIRVHINEVLARWPRTEIEATEDKLGGELWTLYQRLTLEQRDEAPKRLQHALDHFDLAQISTIHGFCGQMLRDYPLESGVDAKHIQTHLTPLFEEIAEDYRSLIISESSKSALRLMNVLSKKLKHDAESLIKICQYLEPEGWSAVYCDPLVLPSTPQCPAPDHLLTLVKQSLACILPPPPSPFADDPSFDLSFKDEERSQLDLTTIVPEVVQPTLFGDLSPSVEMRSDVHPSHVVEAWSQIGVLFDHTVSLRLLPALMKEEWRDSLRVDLEALNQHAVWNAGGGVGDQNLGWEAIDLIVEMLHAKRPASSMVIALHLDLARLSTKGIVSKLNKRKKDNKELLEFTHPLSEILDDLTLLMSEVLVAMRGWFRWGFAVYTQRELTRRKQREGWISTNDLIRLTHAALQKPDGAFLERVRSRFGAALIDEFQDTDPMQWGIFSTFLDPKHSRSITYLIGDPKQSIYRFRGADLNAYLAVKLGIKLDRAFTMSRNFRSDPRVLNALNQHFDPHQELHQVDHWSVIPAGTSSSGTGFFLDEQVPYVHIDGGKPNRASTFPALRWRYFELDLVTKRDELLAEYVAEDISLFLSKSHLIGMPGEERQVGLADIGILTRTNDFAVQVSIALAKRGIASTIRGDGDVFKTRAITQLERLVRAMLLPEDAGALRAALAIELLGFDAWSVRTHSDQLKEVFTDLHGTWMAQGFASAFHALLHDPQLQLIERALRLSDGARDLSRMMHASERIQDRESRFALSPELTLQWLRERRLETDVETSEEDEVRPHIDTDAVQVVTVHRSKGLEYAILFCPDLWVVRRGGTGEICVTEPENPGELRALDMRLEKSDAKALIEKKIVEAGRREERRLLYVALTRAVHHCSIYLSVPKSNFHHSPLYPMFMGAVTLPKSNPKRPAYDSMIIERGEHRFLNASKEVAFEMECRVPKVTLWRGTTQEKTKLAVHITPQPSERDWRISSFTSLAHLIEAKKDRLVALEELPELDEITHGKVLAPIQYQGEQPPLIDVSGSARFGQCLHALLERLNFDECDERNVEYLTEMMLNAWGFDRSYSNRVARGIWLAIHTPLAASQPNPEEGQWAQQIWRQYTLSQFTLRDLARSQRRDEVKFELPLSNEQVLPARLINSILRLDPACHGLPSLPDDLNLMGFLKGSIDLMFRVTQNGQDRYYISDYKTHWLGDENGSQLGHYHPEALREVMNKHHYHLQSHLYQVVLHRLLEQRLGTGYQPEVHFGGSYYLFLRGMAGSESRIITHQGDQGCAGVYFHKPIYAVTELLSLALSNPHEAEQKLSELGVMITH
jgi:exodeoxyribonuclease V beta subunit